MLNLIMLIISFLLIQNPIYNDYDTRYNYYDISRPNLFLDSPYSNRVKRIIDTRKIDKSRHYYLKKNERTRPRIPGRSRGSRELRTTRLAHDTLRPQLVNPVIELFDDNFNDILESYSLNNYHRFLRACQWDCLQKCFHECEVECNRNNMADCIDQKRFEKFQVKYVPLAYLDYEKSKFKI